MNIVITGGASGLGKAIMESLAPIEDHKILFTFNQSDGMASKLEQMFPNAKALKCDFKNESSLESLIGHLDSFDPDCLINNAFPGTIKKIHFHKMDPKIFYDGFYENVFPVIQLNQAALKIFRKKKFGKIITVLSSVLINKPPVGWSEYTAAKAYLHSLSKSWANENSSFNITSNCISPSFMETRLTGDTDTRILEEIKLSHPLKSILIPKEVADAVLFFINASQQINGANLIINAAENVV